jgi:hypothetical protein
MASAVIHISVASLVNKVLNRNNNELFIGTIAPDIAKQIGETKTKSHFLVEDDNIPNLDKFLDKYKNKLDNDFVLGYYIHLFTDYLWFKYFLPEIYDKDIIRKLDGTIVKCEDKKAAEYIYNDYTNMNIKLIDEYNLDLKIFYNEIPEIENIIEEIPMDKLDIVVNKMGEIIINSKVKNDLVFNIEHIKNFISFSTKLILSNLNELNIK